MPRHAPAPKDDPAYRALKDAVIARTGHFYYVDKDDLLFERIEKRRRAVAAPTVAAYIERLSGPGGEAEWNALEAEITIGETFFFRYAEQFAALRKTILPELIEARSEIRRLRIWSAGCST
ncbi:MAG TPA: CheR family methyltransferase, partial [Beijerinckiaceae bacterium]